MDFNIFQPKYLYQTIETLPNMHALRDKVPRLSPQAIPWGARPVEVTWKQLQRPPGGSLFNHFIPTIPTQVPKT